MLQRRMPGRLMGSVPLMGGGQTYIQKVLGIQPTDLILYHPMNEPSGGVANDYSPETNDGAYTGVTLGQPGIGDGNTCPFFDGANDYNNIYSAGLNGDFDGAEGTLSIWAKVNGAGAWTDGLQHWSVAVAVDLVTNSVLIFKDTTNNRLKFKYAAGGVSKEIWLNASPVTWQHYALTWSASSDEMKAYVNGAQTGLTQNGLGIWAGPLSAIRCVVGGGNGAAPVNPYYGWLAHPAIWKVALSAAEIAELAVV